MGNRGFGIYALAAVAIMVTLGRGQDLVATEFVHSTGSLSQARSYLAAASAGDYALFGGGYYNDAYGNSPRSSVVDIFSVATRQWSTANLSQARNMLAATSVGNLAMFGGGYVGGNGLSAYSNTVDIFNASIGQWTSATLSQRRDDLAATSVGNYALFGGGYWYDSKSGSGGYSATVDMYNASTGQWTTAQLSQARADLAATSAGHYALFAGGMNMGANTTVDIFDANTSQWTTASLSHPRTNLAATSVGNYAIFAGGDGGWGNVVDIFNASTGAWTTTTLSRAYWPAATSVGHYALFGGSGNTVDVFDANTGLWSTMPMSNTCGGLAAATVGNTAIFAGGNFGQSLPTIDMYTTPEPATLSLLALGGMAALTRRRRRLKRR